MGAVGLRDLNLSTYPWNEDRMEPDIDGACALIRELEPKVALIGQSVFLFPTPLKEIAEAAHEVGAKVMYDGAHVLGLIAGGMFLASTTGCGSLDADNVSERPWNEPKGYQFFGSGNSRRGNR